MNRVLLIAVVTLLLVACGGHERRSVQHGGAGEGGESAAGSTSGRGSGGTGGRAVAGSASGGVTGDDRGQPVADWLNKGGSGGAGPQSVAGSGESAGVAGEGGQATDVEVTAVEPREGGPGEAVEISGFGLHGAVVRFATTTAVPLSDSDDLIVRAVPALAAGTVQLTVGGVAAGEFEVLPPREVTGIEPGSGVAGDEVTFRGSRLSGAHVRFGSMTAESVSDAASAIVRRVPDLEPGVVAISVDGSEVGTFSVLAAVVDDFSPSSGVIGSDATITGRALTGDDVLVGGVPAEVLTETDTELTIRIPDQPLGFARVAVGGVIAGDFEVLGPRITRVCPSRNPVSGPLQIRGEGLDALSSLQIGSITFAPGDYELRPDGSIVLEVPSLPLGSAAIRAIGADGGPPPTAVEVLPDYPDGVPTSPSAIVGPRTPPGEYIEPVGRSWRNTESSEHWLRLGGDNPCAATPSSGTFGGLEELNGIEYDVAGTYDKAANSLVLEVDRDGVVETYRGEWLDNGYVGIANYHQLLLTSDSECRQVLMEVDTTGLCDE
jgi:hypothetical protein